MSGGWSIVGDGQSISSGQTELCSSGSDPSVTLGITSTSSVYGRGSIRDNSKLGNQSVSLSLDGYDLSVGYNGSVDSTLELSGGSASASAFIGATATGISTGLMGYDVFGSADISTEGYLNGMGRATASSEGSAYYSAARAGTPSEAWGQVSGGSNLLMDCSRVQSLASTGGSENGLHVDSKVSRDIMGVNQSSSVSQITSYASIINPGNVIVSASGTAECGAWGPLFSGQKERMANEDVNASARGMASGFVESGGMMDAADISAVLQSKASRMGYDLYVYGGPATYASSTQSSSSHLTWSEALIQNSTWGSAARSDSGLAAQHGNLSSIVSRSESLEMNASAFSFGKILMKASLIVDNLTHSQGNMSLQTFAQARNNTSTIASTNIGPVGNGSVQSSDTFMINKAAFEGGLYHFSLVNATDQYSETHNILGTGYVDTEPYGNVTAIRPFVVDTTTDPNIAWSGSDGIFYQEH